MLPNLHEARKRKGYTMGSISQLLGITRQAFGYYEKGQRSPDVVMLKKIAEILDCSVDYLLGIEAPTPTPLPKSSDIYTEEEEALIHKFRMLDDRDKEDVLDDIDRKIERMERRYTEKEKHA